MMSGSGEKAGGAPGEKSRGGSVITERGVPNAALTSAARVSVGTLLLRQPASSGDLDVGHGCPPGISCYGHGNDETGDVHGRRSMGTFAL